MLGDGAPPKTGQQRLFISKRTMAASLRIGLASAFLASPFTSQAPAREGDRTLRLYFANTGERGEFTFKRHGRYDRGELARINTFLRDWRRNEPTNMDPALLDLVWTIYRKAGGRGEIHVVSAFRALETNNMLRRRSKGVAKVSQHTAGKAIDFYIPGVPLDRLRAVALKEQTGGVGYYPKSGSPFVHVDTGNVRHWPRMTRQQLIALFPDGETIHVPSDGKPLPGYQRALAAYSKGGARTQVAYADTAPPASRRGSSRRADSQAEREKRTVAAWLSSVFKDDGDAGDEAPVEMARAPAPPPAAATVGTAQEATIAAALGDAPRIPRARPSDLVMAFAAPDAAIAAQDQSGLAELSLAPLPRPRPVDFAIASLADNAAEAPPTARQDDPISDLAARMSVETPVPAGLQVAATEGLARLPSVEDAAHLAALTVAPVPTPRPAERRPQVVAALPDAAPPAVSPADANPAVSVPVPMELRSTDAAPIAARFQAREEPVLPDYSLDRDSLRWLMSAQTTRTQDFAALEMPQPSGAPELYAAPTRAGEVERLAVNDAPRTDRFVASRAEPSGGSFFGRLFGSVTR